MKKAAIVLLTAAMLSTALTGCGGAKEETKPDETAAAETELVKASELTETSEYIAALYAQNDLNGAVINILFSPDYGDAMECELSYSSGELDGDVLKDAVYERSNNVQNGLNCVFKVRRQNINSDEFISYVDPNILAGDVLDIVVTYRATQLVGALNGDFYNLKDIASLDLDKAWWDQQINKNYTYCGDRIQCVAGGDILYNDDYQIQILCFNKLMLENYSLASPYELVSDGSWTLDKFTETATSVYQDLNGDGKSNYGDEFGYVDNSSLYTSFLSGFGMSSVVEDEGGELGLVYDIMGERYYSAGEKLTALLNMTGVMVAEKLGGDFYTKNYEMTVNGQALFFRITMGSLGKYRGIDAFDVGVAPLPKYDEAQEDYGALVGWSGSVIAVGLTSEDAEKTGLALDALAAEGVETVTPVAIDKQIYIKGTRDEESVAMLKLCMASKTYDLLTDYYYDDFYLAFILKASTLNLNLPSFVAANTDIWHTDYENMLEKYQALLDR